MEIIRWVRITTTQGAVLKGGSMRKLSMVCISQSCRMYGQLDRLVNLKGIPDYSYKEGESL